VTHVDERLRGTGRRQRANLGCPETASSPAGEVPGHVRRRGGRLASAPHTHEVHTGESVASVSQEVN
jgi:hypothetical protein